MGAGARPEAAAPPGPCALPIPAKLCDHQHAGEGDDQQHFQTAQARGGASYRGAAWVDAVGPASEPAGKGHPFRPAARRCYPGASGLCLSSGTSAGTAKRCTTCSGSTTGAWPWSALQASRQDPRAPPASLCPVHHARWPVCDASLRCAAPCCAALRRRGALVWDAAARLQSPSGPVPAGLLLLGGVRAVPWQHRAVRGRLWAQGDGALGGTHAAVVRRGPGGLARLQQYGRRRASLGDSRLPEPGGGDASKRCLLISSTISSPLPWAVWRKISSPEDECPRGRGFFFLVVVSKAGRAAQASGTSKGWSSWCSMPQLSGCVDAPGKSTRRVACFSC